MMNNTVSMQRQQQPQKSMAPPTSYGAPSAMSMPPSAMSMPNPSAPMMGGMGQQQLQQQQQPYNSMPPRMPMQAGGMPMQAGGMPMQQPYGQQGGMPMQGGVQQPYGQQAGMPMQGGNMMQQPYGQQAGMPMQGGVQQPYGQPMQQQYGNPPMGQFGQPAMGGMGMGMGGGTVGSVSLAKGGNASLTKIAPNLTNARIGLGWDVRQGTGAAFDLDASAFMLKADGRVRMPQDLIFYNNKQSVDGSVFHHGDNLTGAGEGDDEMVSVDLSRVPMDIQKIVFVCSIYEAEMRQQNFGMVSRAFIRVCDGRTTQEICRYDLSEEASMFSTMIFGEVYRYNNEWKFRAVGQGIQGGLRTLGNMFGLALQ